MINFFVITLALFSVAVLWWNFVPGVREWLRGKTTVLEGIVAASFSGASVAAETFQAESEFWASIIPDASWKWVTVGLALWMIFKRVVTTTAVGKDR